MKMRNRTSSDSWNNVKRLINDYGKQHWRPLIIAVLFALIFSMSPYVYGFLSQIMLDDVLELGPAESVEETDRIEKSVDEKLRLLAFMFLIYVVVHIVFEASNWLYAYIITSVGQRVVFKIRQRLHDKLQTLQVTFFDQQQTGKIMARLFDDVAAIEESVSGVLVGLIRNIGMIAIGTVILVRLDWQLALIALSTMPFYAIGFVIYAKKIQPINERIRKSNSELHGIVGQSIPAIRVIQSFVNERYEIGRFFHRSAELVRLHIKHAVLGNALGSVSGIISTVGTVLVFYFGALKIKRGEMSFGEFTFFTASVVALFGPIINLANMNTIIQWVLTALRRVFEMMDRRKTIDDAKDAVSLPDIKGHIIFSNVSLRYEDADRLALEDINLDILPGTVVALIGASGSGKTSLVNLLLRFYDATEGYILIDGYDTRDIRLSSLRDNIRMVSQEPVLFSGTIAENIRYGEPDASPRRIVESAVSAELHDYVMTLPAKYETEIGEGGVSLSGGQKQRMAIAMALLTDPCVLVLDDSTSALDAKTEARIQKTLEKVILGKTAFIITHRMSTAAKADMILVLDNGRIAERGTHEELMNLRGSYYNYFMLQKR